MSKEIKTKILIHATPQKVWSVLTNFEAYPQWNPFIKSISGKLELGSKIRVRLEPPEAKGMDFKPKIISYQLHKEFSWLGHLFIPGLFDGAHKFELIDLGNGKTEFIHSEKFGGILVPLFKKMLDHNTKKGFEAMNEKLKLLSETE